MTTSNFYVTGGTLGQDAPSYVERHADTELFEALQQGEYCYVLTPRQMGKSSLIVRTAQKLRAEGIAVANLDLTALGQNLTPEQWYGGLLEIIGANLGMEDELDRFWAEHEDVGPLRRFMRALREVVLPALSVEREALSVKDGKSVEGEALSVTGETPDLNAQRGCPRSGRSLTAASQRSTPDAQRLIVFIDEIDTVRSLSFSTDEFFAGIRECYNRRSEDPEYERLTFCLLGVASPSDLIRDTRTTPFNVGRRIELTDFTEEEADLLRIGLEVGDLGTPGRPEKEARALVKRVLYWTGGHPYLTQRLCQALLEHNLTPRPPLHLMERGSRASDGGEVRLPTPQLVDEVCARLFLTRSAKEKDDNLIFVRERLLKSEADRAALLELYRQVWLGRRIPDDETDPLCTLLKLSGVVAPLCKGQRAWSKGQGSGVPDSLLSALCSLPKHSGSHGALLAVRNRIYARVFDRRWVALHMPDVELRRQKAAYWRGIRRAASAASLILAVIAALGAHAFHNARLAAARGIAAEASRRELRQNLYAADMQNAQIADKDDQLGRMRELLSGPTAVADYWPVPGEEDLRTWEWRYLSPRSQDTSLKTFAPSEFKCAAFANGREVAVGTRTEGIAFYDLAGRPLRRFPRIATGTRLWVSPDSRRLVAQRADHTLAVYWLDGSRAPTILLSAAEAGGWLPLACLSADGRMLAYVRRDGSIALRELDSGVERTAIIGGSTGDGAVAALSPDGRWAAGSDGSGTLLLRDMRAPAARRIPGSAADSITAIGFDALGARIATGYVSGRIVVRELPSGRKISTSLGQRTYVYSLSFSPDGRTLASCSTDGTVALWDTVGWLRQGVLRGHPTEVNSIQFSPDGRLLLTTGMEGAKLWDTAPAAVTDECPGESFVLSPDSRTVAVSSYSSGTVRLLSTREGRETGRLAAPGSTLSLVAFRPGGDSVVMVETNPARLSRARLTAWRLTTGRREFVLDEHVAVPLGLSPSAGFTLSPDGRYLIRAYHSFDLWNVASRRRLSVPPVLAAMPSIPQHAVFSPDGGMVAVPFSDGEVQVLETGSWKRVGPVLDGGASPCSFTPDGRFLITSGGDGMVHIWNLRTWAEIRRFSAHTGAVWAVTVSPDCRTLVTADASPSVQLWNTRTWRPTLRLGEDAITQAAFTHDGNTLITAGAGGRVHFWRASPVAATDSSPLQSAR